MSSPSCHVPKNSAPIQKSSQSPNLDGTWSWTQTDVCTPFSMCDNVGLKSGSEGDINRSTPLSTVPKLDFVPIMVATHAWTWRCGFEGPRPLPLCSPITYWPPPSIGSGAEVYSSDSATWRKRFVQRPSLWLAGRTIAVGAEPSMGTRSPRLSLFRVQVVRTLPSNFLPTTAMIGSTVVKRGEEAFRMVERTAARCCWRDRSLSKPTVARERTAAKDNSFIHAQNLTARVIPGRSKRNYLNHQVT